MSILVLCGGILLGTFLGLVLPGAPPIFSVVTAGGLIVLGGFISSRYRLGRLLAIGIAAVFLGGLRSHVEFSTLSQNALPPESTGVSGIVLETPRRTGQAHRFVVLIDHIALPTGWVP